MPFQIYIGGRGVGKTYSALVLGLKKKFLYLRRTATELETVASGFGNPFKVINRDYEVNVQCEYNSSLNFGAFTLEDETIGYCTALSTFAGLRGADFSDVELIIFEEFIPEVHKRKIKNEGDAFLNVYETINRNREMQGQPPVMVLFLANSISLDNPILLSLDAVKILQHMITKNQARFTDKERCLYIERVDNVGVTKDKVNTALYKLTKNSDFREQALDNKFSNDELHRIAKVQIQEYKPTICIGRFTIYQHKSENLLHIAMKQETAKKMMSEKESGALRRTFAIRYQIALDKNLITYDNYNTKLLFEELLARK